MARNVPRPSVPPEPPAALQATARERFTLIEEFLARTAAGQPEAAARTRLARQFAVQLGVSRATFYRLLGRHAEGGTVDALLPRPAGVKRHQQRLPATVEAVIRPFSMRRWAYGTPRCWSSRCRRFRIRSGCSSRS